MFINPYNDMLNIFCKLIPHKGRGEMRIRKLLFQATNGSLLWGKGKIHQIAFFYKNKNDE